jgi:hypothetical protein
VLNTGEIPKFKPELNDKCDDDPGKSIKEIASVTIRKLFLSIGLYSICKSPGMRIIVVT